MRLPWILTFVLVVGAFLLGVAVGSSRGKVLSIQSFNLFATPTPTLPPLPTGTPIPSEAPTQSQKYPSQVLDLTNWKITLPLPKPKSSSSPLEILQPKLATYKIDPWFVVAPDGNSVIFRAPVNAPTTSGSKYPRSELREMTNNGTMPAAWSSTQGTHTMTIEESINRVPQVKRHIVAGQIHDDNDDIMVIRLEYPNLYVNVGGKNVHTLDSSYTLGKKFKIKFVANNGKTDVYYNDNPQPVYTLNLDYNNAYFKAGAYTQSNCSKEGDPSLCTADNYGEVQIYALNVTDQ